MTNIHERDRMGRTPLHYAAIDRPDGTANDWKETDPARKAELHQRSVEFKLANVRHLIDSGADVNATDDNGDTPLHFAATHDSAEVVKMLLDAGADVDAVNAKGETPLKRAVADPWIDINTLQLLRDRGADPFRQANNGRSAIDTLRIMGDEARRAAFADLL